MAYFDVEVVISAAQASGKAGDWFPLIYVVGETEKYGEYASIEEVMVDYPEATDAYKAALLMFRQDNKPAKIAICTSVADVATGLANHISKDWRQIIVINETKKYDKAVADYIELTEKVYFTHFATKEELVSAKITDYDRTVGIVYTAKDVDFPEVAIIGRTAGYKAGEATYHCKEVKGVTPDVFSETDLKAIHAAGGFAYVEKNGRTATSEGIVGSGEYIDVIDSYDYLIQNIRYAVQEVFLNNAKVAYTNEGINLINNAVYGVLLTAFNNGMIATDDDGKAVFSTTFKSRSETTVEDRTTRNYPYGTFAFELAGAIHKAKITGTVTA